jgi:hypothetical protein
MDWDDARMWETQNRQIVAGKTLGKRSLKRSRRRW